MNSPRGDAPICTNCKKPQSDFPDPLKRCAKCQNSLYCSRECQKADWKVHKRSCGSTAGNQSNAGPSSSTLPQIPPGVTFSGIDGRSGRGYGNTTVNPFDFDALQLNSLSEEDAFTRIIDSYRLRMEDEVNFRGDVKGVYDGEDPLEDFQDYLKQAEERGGCLPTWWSAEKSRACQAQGMKRTGWSQLRHRVEKSDIQEHYRDPMMPMKLRVLAERITGSNVMSPG